MGFDLELEWSSGFYLLSQNWPACFRYGTACFGCDLGGLNELKHIYIFFLEVERKKEKRIPDTLILVH